MKMKLLIYWRILFFVVLLLTFIKKVISFEIFMSIIIGILLFSIIPDSIEKLEKKSK